MGFNFQAFQPHQFNESHIELYHVYDNLSQTPFRPGIGIEGGDPNNYWMGAWHIITPKAMFKHLDWKNRSPTQFISFYDDLGAARREAARRRRQQWVPGSRWRDPNSVRIAHVRLDADSNVWVFSRKEMLDMMRAIDPSSALELLALSGANNWFVYGDVPLQFIVNRREL